MDGIDRPARSPIPGSQSSKPVRLTLRHTSSPDRSLTTTASISEAGLTVRDEWYDGDAECEVEWLVPADRIPELLEGLPGQPSELLPFLRAAQGDAAAAHTLIAALCDMAPSVCTHHWLSPGESLWGSG